MHSLALAAAVALAGDTAMDAPTLAHEVDRLASTTRVLYVAAHPDDENTRLLAYLANVRHYEAAYLSMTRGGGGQNLIGSEQGELLDVIRTEELLAARDLDGATQRFTTMRDFGFSKTPDETFRIWGKEEALADVVLAIRKFQPDVIVTRFDENPPNHGHHTASAILAREAFTAAADPNRFPEQLKDGVTVWKTERLLHNLSPWREGPIPKDAITLDIGSYDPRRGLGMGELAAKSRSQHKSQGFGVPGERGQLLERFVLLAGSKPGSDPFDGITPGWSRFGAAATPYAKAIDEARAALDRDHPERAVPALVRAHQALDALPDSVRVHHARASLERVIVAATGLFVRATAPTPMVVPGAKVKLDVELVRGLAAPLEVRRVAFPDGAADVGALGTNEKKVISREITIPADASITTPYWLASPPSAGRFDVSDRSLIGAPRGPSALHVGVELAVEGRAFRLTVPVVHAWTDSVHGERIRELVIVPPATVTPVRSAIMFPNGKAAPLDLRVRAGQDALSGEVRLPLPVGWTSKPALHAISLAKAGDEMTVRFDVTPPAKATSEFIAPQFVVGERAWSYRADILDYPHIPLQLVLQPSRVRLSPVALQLPKGTVGYIPGPGDSVSDDLAHVGLHVETIDEPTLRSGDLSRFSSIVVGIRAWNTRPVMRTAHPRLMRFVEQGGTLVVQYNTNSRLAPLTTPLGPYPFEVGRDRITDETATMTPVDPKHRALLSPNVITPADFEGWVQERGIYFASTWDPKYQTLFSAQDPGEKPLNGGTLVTTYGKGRFVYTGLAFFRQLPAGVPGAYRLFVNLLAR